MLRKTLTLLTLTAAAHAQSTLMPLPAHVRSATGNVPITNTLTFSFTPATSEPLHAAVLRTISQIQNETGIQFTTPLASGKATIDIQVTNASETIPQQGDDESYTLDIENGSAVIKAPTLFGAYHALETLLQLPQSQGQQYLLPAVHIADAPRFPWRGLMIDSGRHFEPVSQILRTIDGMAAVKLNVLHLHLTENQGFRIESLRYPKLQGMGSEGLFYTQSQIREIVSYAAARGIRVVPEFDIPGHSTSWVIGYPELASGPGPYHLEKTFGVFDEALDPTRESTYEFLDAFFAEMTQLFPDHYFHIGGDESNGKEWRDNPKIVAFMHAHNLADTKALQAYFNHRVEEIVKKYHRTMVGWDEILHPDLSPDVVIQNWHGVEFLINGAKQAHEGLLSQPFYLDHSTTAGQMYAADPVPANSDLTPDQIKLILGGEACMWGEQVVEPTIDSRIWPRTAAVAERLWSPQNVRDEADMYRRLEVESLRLDALGLKNISGPQRLLRQLSGSESSPALETFVATLKPVDFGARYRYQHNTRDTPMTGIVDAARPDPPLREALIQLVAAYLAAPSGPAHDDAHHQLETLFHSWIATGPALDDLAKTHRSFTPTPAQTELLKTAAKPSTELVDFAILQPLQTLVQAATTIK